MVFSPAGKRQDTGQEKEKDFRQGKPRPPKDTVITYSFIKSQPWRMLFEFVLVLVFSGLRLNEVTKVSHPALSVPGTK